MEFLYYLAAIFYFGGIRTWTRYLDWVVSTPLMLTSTIAFLLYRAEPSAGLAEVFDGANLLPTLAVLTLNWVMLLAGFLVEVGASPYRTATLLPPSGLESATRSQPRWLVGAEQTRRGLRTSCSATPNAVNRRPSRSPPR